MPCAIWTAGKSARYISTRVKMPFEDTRFYAPAGWDELLTQLYGDYMKLPPKEKQIPEHSDMEIKIYD